jgi:ribosomal protein S18 acetylase RimI-like enzyme
LALTDAPYAFGSRLEDVLLEPNEKFELDAVRHSESNESTSFIAFDNEIPVGMVGAFFELPSQQAFICSLWVEPDCRSRLLATYLLEAAKVVPPSAQRTRGTAHSMYTFSWGQPNASVGVTCER